MLGKTLTQTLVASSIIPLLVNAATLGSFDSPDQETTKSDEVESSVSVAQNTLDSQPTTSDYDLLYSTDAMTTTSQINMETRTLQETVSTQSMEVQDLYVATQDSISNDMMLSASTTTMDWDSPLTTITTTNSAGETYTSEIWWLPSTTSTISTVTGSLQTVAFTMADSSSTGSASTTATVDTSSSNGANSQVPNLVFFGAALALII